jgi:hypothetical protein
VPSAYLVLFLANLVFATSYTVSRVSAFTVAGGASIPAALHLAVTAGRAG